MKSQAITVIQRIYTIFNDFATKPAHLNIGGVEEISFLHPAIHKPTGDKITLKKTHLRNALNDNQESIPTQHRKNTKMDTYPDVFVEEIIQGAENNMLCRHENILPIFKSFVSSETLWIVTFPLKGKNKKVGYNKHNADVRLWWN